MVATGHPGARRWVARCLTEWKSAAALRWIGELGDAEDVPGVLRWLEAESSGHYSQPAGDASRALDAILRRDAGRVSDAALRQIASLPDGRYRRGIGRLMDLDLGALRAAAGAELERRRRPARG
jgi:hypothetical protein